MRAAVSIAAGMAVVSITVAAAPAHADEYGFVSDLVEDGVYYQSITDLVNLGNLSCGELRSGAPVQQVVQDIFDHYQPPPVQGDHPGRRLTAVMILNRSTFWLRPDQMYRVDEFINGGN